MNLTRWPAPTAERLPGEDGIHWNRWLTFNSQLDRDAADLINETTLTRHLETLQSDAVVDSGVFWLSVGRLTEMTLKLAGDYADACHFQAAGDLLLNPRWIDVHQRKCELPVRKDRHRGLSEQFAEVIGKRNSVTWLSRHTFAHIRAQALLPCLQQMLSASGFMTADYLSTLKRRMAQVADTIAFLSAWQITVHKALCAKINLAGGTDRRLISNNLCRFDLEPFVAMGDDIDSIIFGSSASGRFLRKAG